MNAEGPMTVTFKSLHVGGDHVVYRVTAVRLDPALPPGSAYAELHPAFWHGEPLLPSDDAPPITFLAPPDEPVGRLYRVVFMRVEIDE